MRFTLSATSVHRSFPCGERFHTVRSGWLACVLLATAVVFAQPAQHPAQQAEGGILAVLRFSNGTDDARFDDFHLLLRKRLEYEMLVPGLPVKAWGASHDQLSDIDKEELAKFQFTVYGSFWLDLASQETVLTFAIVDRNDGKETGKRIMLRGMNVNEIADIVVMKVSNTLRSNILGKLNVTSSPARCEILLNGVSTGLTPKEFSLEPGKYWVEVRGEFLQPFKTEVDLAAGASRDLYAPLDFRGYPVAPWLFGAVAGVASTAIAWGAESRYHREYKALSHNASTDEFAHRFEAYRSANTVRVTLQCITTIPLTGASFTFVINRSLKKRVLAHR